MPSSSLQRVNNNLAGKLLLCGCLLSVLLCCDGANGTPPPSSGAPPSMPTIAVPLRCELLCNGLPASLVPDCLNCLTTPVLSNMPINAWDVTGVPAVSAACIDAKFTFECMTAARTAGDN